MGIYGVSTLDKKAYSAARYQANKEALKAKAREYHKRVYKEKWAAATEEEKQARRDRCNADAAKTKPWITRRKRRPEAYLLNVARQRSRVKGIEFDIGIEDIQMPTVCPLLGIMLDSYAEDMDVHPSIDRIDSSRGYVKGNVWIISHRANRIKSDATWDELLRIATALKEKLL